MAVVGIDLGTTHSLVATLERGRPRLFTDLEGNSLIPSVIAQEAGGPLLIGTKARELRSTSPRSTLFSTKRFMGRGAADIATTSTSLPFDTSPSDEKSVRFRFADGVLTPIDVAAKILSELKSLAERGLGQSVDRAVITVPAYFDDAQRHATKTAAKLAGLDVLRLLNEPTAASLAYGLDKKAHGTIAVFDFGGGTFDVSILKVHEGVFEVLSTGGDTLLGGDDIDHAIAGALAIEIENETGESVTSDAVTYARLLVESERLKVSLSDKEESELRFTIKTGTFHRTVTRLQIESWSAAVLSRLEEPCLRALEDAKLKKSSLSDVILVGGSTRMPAVRELVTRLFGREPLCSLDPDQVVAIGAAVQANTLTGQSDGMLLLDVIPLSLGIETMGGVVAKILHRNSTVPVSASEHFSTYVDGQTSVDIHVVQGERELAADNRGLARFQLRGIPPLPAGVPKIEVEFVVDANGLLTVRAMELRTGTRAQVAVNPTFGLTDEEVETRLLESHEYAEKDFEQRFLIEARQEAEIVLRSTRKSIHHAADLLDDEEKTAIAASISALERVITHETNYRTVREATEDLNTKTKPFAERLLNAAVSNALQGTTITGSQEGDRR